MTYRIRYRCRKPTDGIVPFLEVHYKKSGGFVWRESEYNGYSVDKFAWKERRKLYEDYCIKCDEKLADIDSCKRVRMICEIINDVFGGLEQYVITMIRQEVLLDMAEKGEIEEINRIVESILTDGREWASTTVEITL